MRSSWARLVAALCISAPPSADRKPVPVTQSSEQLRHKSQHFAAVAQGHALTHLPTLNVGTSATRPHPVPTKSLLVLFHRLGKSQLPDPKSSARSLAAAYSLPPGSVPSLLSRRSGIHSHRYALSAPPPRSHPSHYHHQPSYSQAQCCARPQPCYHRCRCERLKRH